jgi:nitrogen fixation protein NifZ
VTAQPKVFGEAGPYGAELHVGDDVRAVRPLRQDGTFPDPGVAVGEVLVPEGTLGQIVDVGLYLQERIVYAVMFGNGRLVGCLEPELECARSATPIPGGDL